MSTNIPNNGLQSCEVLPNSSWYLGCNGTRVKSPLYQRKMNDLFALINHFDDVVFNYVSLEVRKCLLYRYVRTGEVRNHHEKVDGSILVYSQSKKKKKQTKEMIISVWIYFARSTYKGEWFYACVWRHTEYLHVVIRANKSTTFLAKKAVPSCLVILGFNVTPPPPPPKKKGNKTKKKSNHSKIK